MPEPDLKPTARLLADWIEGKPGDAHKTRRARLLAYRNVGRNPYHLGILLTRAAFKMAMEGQSPAPDPAVWAPLITAGDRHWENRILLAAEVLALLQQRGVSVATDRVDVEVAREEAAGLLAEMAASTDDPVLKNVDWAAELQQDEAEYHFGGA